MKRDNYQWSSRLESTLNIAIRTPGLYPLQTADHMTGVLGGHINAACRSGSSRDTLPLHRGQPKEPVEAVRPW